MLSCSGRVIFKHYILSSSCMCSRCLSHFAVQAFKVKCKVVLLAFKYLWLPLAPSPEGDAAGEQRAEWQP